MEVNFEGEGFPEGAVHSIAGVEFHLWMGVRCWGNTSIFEDVRASPGLCAFAFTGVHSYFAVATTGYCAGRKTFTAASCMPCLPSN